MERAPNALFSCRCFQLQQEPKCDGKLLQLCTLVQAECKSCKSRLMDGSGDGGRSKTNGPIKSLKEAEAYLLCVTG